MPKKAKQPKKTNKGRKPLGEKKRKKLSVALLPSLLERLGKYAADTKITRSAALEKLADRALHNAKY